MSVPESLLFECTGIDEFCNADRSSGRIQLRRTYRLFFTAGPF